MKKTYSKPEIVFESFVMNVNIAACIVDTNNPTRNTCNYQFGEDKVFLDSQICEFVVVDGSIEAGGTCYHNPTDTTRLFNS